MKPDSVRKDLIRWRGIWNLRDREIREDELSENYSNRTQDGDGDDSTVESNSGRHTGGKRKNYNSNKFRARRGTKAKKKTKLRRTKQEEVGNDPGIIVSMRSTDDDTSSGDEQDDESSDQEQEERRYKKRRAKFKSGNKRRPKGRRNPILRRGVNSPEKPRAIIDPGTEVDVIGGVGWHVLTRLENHKAQLDGALEGMGTRALQIVNAVTAYDHPSRGTILLGAGCAGWDDRAEQTESLFNSHDLRKNNVVVNDTAERDGGAQSLEINGIEIKLDFVDEKTLSFNLRKPTEEELADLQINWLTNNDPEDRKKLVTTRRSPGGIVPIPRPWDERLGNAPEHVTVKTLEATTQLCSAPVEMENRENPRQHRMKRIHPMHPTRIPGRTDSDTFFASVKSVQGFKCVQIFYTLVAKFIFVMGMRKESHSHNAYQDFIREVGAPATLLTDNSRTQTGKKWTETSRRNVTRQRHISPHNQNQNESERIIGTVKRRTVLTMRYANAPLVFWCYCMYFIVACLNHTAQKKLGYRTSMEKMFGHTPDISMFRFSFWEPVWYYEPTAKYPEPNFLPARHVGIAWKHGDAFTYKVWTTPDGKWEDGCELIRNIVRSRVDQDDNAPFVDYTCEDLQFDSTSLTRKQIKKRHKNAKKRDADTDMNIGHRKASKVRFQLSPQDNDSNQEEMGAGKEYEQQDQQDQETNNNSTLKLSFNNDNAPNSPINRKRKPEEEEIINPLDTFDPDDSDEPFEMDREVGDILRPDTSPPTVGGACVEKIVEHKWYIGQLKFKVMWSTDQTNWEDFRDMKEDHPLMTTVRHTIIFVLTLMIL